MANADVAVGVDHVLMGENAVGNHEIAQNVVELAHDGSSHGAKRNEGGRC